MVLHALSGICCKVGERYWEGKFAAVRQKISPFIFNQDEETVDRKHSVQL